MISDSIRAWVKQGEQLGALREFVEVIDGRKEVLVNIVMTTEGACDKEKGEALGLCWVQSYLEEALKEKQQDE